MHGKGTEQHVDDILNNGFIEAKHNLERRIKK